MITLNAMVAVQAPNGLACGAARGIDQELLLFEIEADLPVGGSVLFSLELPGLDEKIMGTLGHIGEARADTGRRSWTARIMSLEASDREVFEIWRAAAEKGNRAMTHTRLTDADGWARSGTMTGSSSAERAHAMAAQEERRKRRLMRAREFASSKKKLWPDPGDDRAAEAKQLFSELSSVSGRASLRTSPPQALTAPAESGPSGRAAVSAVLRDRITVGRTPPPLASPPPAPAPPDSDAHAKAGRVSDPTLDPTAELRPDGLWLRWRSLEAYQRDWRQNLRASALLVSIELPGRSSVDVHLVLPSGTAVHCAGDVAHRSPVSTGLTLRLGPEDRAALRPPA